MIFTGVGSREINQTGINRIIEVASILQKTGAILRSGGADGSDQAFESCFLKEEQKEIYLPWKNAFNNSSAFCFVGKEAMALAATIHPVFDRLKPGAQKLHARNCYQVLGWSLKNKSDILICWTKDGAVCEKETTSNTGGTRTAIVLADRMGVPVFNLNKDTSYDTLMGMLLKRQFYYNSIKISF